MAWLQPDAQILLPLSVEVVTNVIKAIHNFAGRFFPLWLPLKHKNLLSYLDQFRYSLMKYKRDCLSSSIHI